MCGVEAWRNRVSSRKINRRAWVLYKILQSVGQQFRSPMNSCGLFRAFQMTPTVETTFANLRCGIGLCCHPSEIVDAVDRPRRRHPFTPPASIHLGFLWIWAGMLALPRSAAAPLTTTFPVSGTNGILCSCETADFFDLLNAEHQIVLSDHGIDHMGLRND